MATAVTEYFAALQRRETTGFDAYWAPDGVDELHGQAVLNGPREVEGYFTELFTAFPDWDFQVLDTVEQGDRTAVHWQASGTFAGGPLNGFEPNGARVKVTGIDLLQVGADGKIVRNDAYPDGMSLARQLGALPPLGSTQEARLAGLLNLKTKIGAKLMMKPPEEVAPGVWLVRGDTRGAMAVYFIEEPGGGVVMFDAGTAAMANGLAAAGAKLGGINRIVLGHSHVDHRGAAPALAESGIEVFCHPDEVADAEGDGGVHYQDFSQVRYTGRLYKHVLFPKWDGGPVQISGTVEEGEDVAGFEVVHCPGHAPGLIALHRASDGVVLCSDVVYMSSSETFRPYDEPQVPIAPWNLDHQQALASARKLAALDPKVIWTGHDNRPVEGDVRRKLEAAADHG
jgi:glyoxylase-like metal-dependent hydrolase (beta-lactamase superfamily II)/predicted ester cyclase